MSLKICLNILRKNKEQLSTVDLFTMFQIKFKIWRTLKKN